MIVRSPVLARHMRALAATNFWPHSARTAATMASTLAVKGAHSAVRRMGSQSSPVGLVDSNKMDLVLQQRRKLLKRCPFQLLHIKGVTFDNKQELVQQLVPGQPVMFLKEPSNPHDPTAVQIATLDGQQLGHVSRFVTAAFPLQACFGSVVSVGQAVNSGNWGALVSCCPSLHGLTLDLLPSSWQDNTNMEQVLGAANWQKLQQLTLAKYKQHCAISSIQQSPDITLQVVPHWGFDYFKKQVFLAGVIPLSEPLVELKQLVAKQGLEKEKANASSGELQAAVEAMCQLMCWPQQEAQKYVQFAQQQRQLVERDGWQLILPVAEELLAAAAAAGDACADTASADGADATAAGNGVGDVALQHATEE